MNRIQSHDLLYRLERQGPELVAAAAESKLEFTYERSDLLARLVVLLHDRSVLLVGEEGVGKRSLVRSLAYRIYQMQKQHTDYSSADSSTEFPHRAIYMTDPFALDLDTHYAGELGNKLSRIARQAEEEHALLYVLDLEVSANTGAASNAPAASVANVLGANLERYDFRVIGSTTPHGHTRLQHQAPSLLRHFAVLEVGPVDRAELTQWFQRLENHLRSRAPVAFGDGYLSAVLDACDRFYAARPYPGKAIELTRQILAEQQTAREADALASARPTERSVTLTPSHVHEHIARLSGLSAEMIDSRPVPRAALDVGLRSFFEARIIGQPAAVHAAVEVVTRYRSRLVAPDKPIAVLWLAGPTGVGKTEFAKIVSEFFFGSRGRLLRYDMSEMVRGDSVERLLGETDTRWTVAAPSLVESVRSQPFSVVLFDEIEKAHPRVLDLFLQLFDEARLTGSNGQVAHFTNTLIMVTSNLGGELFGRSSFGFGGSDTPEVDPEQLRRYLEESFRPEFVNRIEHIVPFRHLTRDAIERILVNQLRGLRALPGLRGVRALFLHPDVHRATLDEGHQPRYGARPLRRAVDRHVVFPLARLLATEAVAPGASVAIEPLPSGARLAEAPPGRDWICVELSRHDGR